jgi:hypothetical protein
MASKARKAAAAAAAAKTVSGAAEAARDRADDLRAAARSALESASVLTDALGSGASDLARRRKGRKLHKRVSSAAQSLSAAADQVRGGRRKRRGRGLLVLVFGGVVALFNPVTGPAARGWIKDRVFGPEEEFEYIPNQPPAGSSD